MIYSSSGADKVKIGTYGIFSNDLESISNINLKDVVVRKTHIMKLKGIKERKRICERIIPDDYYYGDYFEISRFISENGKVFMYFKPVFSEENKDVFYHYWTDGSVKDKDGNIYDLNVEKEPDWLNEKYTKVMLSDVVKICKNEYRSDDLNITGYNEENKYKISRKYYDKYFSAIVNLTKFLKDNNITKFFTKNGMTNVKFGLKHNRKFDKLYDKYMEYVIPFVESINEILVLDSQCISYIRHNIYENMYYDLYNLIPNKYLNDIGFDSFLDISENNSNFRKFNEKLYNMFIENRNVDCLITLIYDYNNSVVEMLDFLEDNNFNKLLTRKELLRILYEREADTQEVMKNIKIFDKFREEYVTKYVESYKKLTCFGRFDEWYNNIVVSLKQSIRFLYKLIPDDNKPQICGLTYSNVVDNCKSFYSLNLFVQKLLLD